MQALFGRTGTGPCLTVPPRPWHYALGASLDRSAKRPRPDPKALALKLRAFLVEDNDIIRNNLTETLSELANVEVIGSAGRESDAVDWLAANEDRWSMAIVDLFLLEGNGIGVVAACRDRKPGQKVAVVTNYATPAMRRRCLDYGADAVFDKSTELDALLDYCVSSARS